MNDIRISLHEPTAHGRLIYQPDPQVEKHLLFISSPERSPRKYTLNINGGQIIFGIDENFTVQSVEFNIPRTAWKITPRYETPHTNRSASLLVKGIDERLTQIEWPRGTVTVNTDNTRSYAHVALGHAPPRATWVALSEQVLALVMEDSLKGFFVFLVK